MSALGHVASIGVDHSFDSLAGVVSCEDEES